MKSPDQKWSGLSLMTTPPSLPVIPVWCVSAKTGIQYPARKFAGKRSYLNWLLDPRLRGDDNRFPMVMELLEWSCFVSSQPRP